MPGKIIQNKRLVQIRASREFELAINAACEREQMSIAEFARRALMKELRRLRIDPAQFREAAE
jgi:hypothetical protein